MESLEDRTFDQVAKWIREVRDIDMYPNHASIHAGIKNGEIDKKVFEDVLQEDINAFDTPLKMKFTHIWIMLNIYLTLMRNILMKMIKQN